MGSKKNLRPPHKAYFKRAKKVRVEQMKIGKQMKGLSAQDASRHVARVPASLRKWCQWKLFNMITTSLTQAVTGNTVETPTVAPEMSFLKPSHHPATPTVAPKMILPKPSQPQKLNMLADLASKSSSIPLKNCESIPVESGKDGEPRPRRSQRNSEANKGLDVSSVWLQVPARGTAASRQAQNSVVLDGTKHFVETPPLLLKESEINGAGTGLFSKGFINKHAIVTEYQGVLISTKQGKALIKRGGHRWMRTVVHGGGYAIDGRPRATGFHSLRNMARRSHVGAMINDTRNSSKAQNVE
jgi:hypothetical protein